MAFSIKRTGVIKVDETNSVTSNDSDVQYINCFFETNGTENTYLTEDYLAGEHFYEN